MELLITQSAELKLTDPFADETDDELEGELGEERAA
jgi:hypothetical protein